MALYDDIRPIEEPLAELERQLIDEFLTRAGQDSEALRARDDEAARRLLTEAAHYAAARLAEVEARSHYLRALHGQE